jgi:hypothetical protein
VIASTFSTLTRRLNNAYGAVPVGDRLLESFADQVNEQLLRIRRALFLVLRFLSLLRQECQLLRIIVTDRIDASIPHCDKHIILVNARVALEKPDLVFVGVLYEPLQDDHESVPSTRVAPLGALRRDRLPLHAKVGRGPFRHLQTQKTRWARVAFGCRVVDSVAGSTGECVCRKGDGHEREGDGWIEKQSREGSSVRPHERMKIRDWDVSRKDC